MIARGVFAALPVVVAKAPYTHESDSSIFALLQTLMIKCGKVSGFAGQIVYTTKQCEFTRHRIHFRFRIQNLQKLYQIDILSSRIQASA